MKRLPVEVLQPQCRRRRCVAARMAHQSVCLSGARPDVRRNRMQVVAERWGSLNSLTAGLTEQKAAHGELPARRRQSSQHAAHRNLPQTCSQAAELCSIVLACLSSAGTSAGCRLHACMHNTSIRAQAVLSDTVCCCTPQPRRIWWRPGSGGRPRAAARIRGSSGAPMPPATCR